ncbi:pyrroloquinoline quinone biosynthesis peptide chaperone PqqD [Loktanella salsilacus]|jgi:pyrroloquinoline quinone biosynthesis protein D|uniref:pyrroloquinoline quinone biosynthesis peptide chaperone PqqD n=1 Tax=Loktanella salsilacus TaxID=195913 RepID=UPI0037041CF0
MADFIPVIPRGVRLHFDRVREKWVLLAPERAITLDPIGLAILNAVDGTRPLSAIAQDLAAKYDAPLDLITTDLRDFVTDLMDRRILEAQP